MGKGSGGARSATAPKSSQTSNTTSIHSMYSDRVTAENIKEMQAKVDKGDRVFSGMSKDEIDNDDRGYKVKPGDIVAPKNDPRSATEIVKDVRPLSSFAKLNPKGIGYAENIGEGSRKAILPSVEKFNKLSQELKDRGRRIESLKEKGLNKRAESLREENRKTRKELLKLGEEITNFELKNGRNAPNTGFGLNPYASLFSDYR